MSHDPTHYLRIERMPHIFCPGCGHGIAMQSFLRAVDKLEMDKDNLVVVSGIGCSSRITGYLDFNTLHTTHGRAIPFATGVKLAKPELDVVVIAGDGDVAAIGGNHLIHACRRNIDLTLLILNNSIYGMTGGQSSPMTNEGALSTTAPFGHLEQEFDICKLAAAAGATYVARATCYHVTQMNMLITKAIKNKGFSVVEVLSDCPTYFGRKNKMPEPFDMLMRQKTHTYSSADAKRLDPAELEGKVMRGVIHQSERPEYVQVYQELIEGLQ